MLVETNRGQDSYVTIFDDVGAQVGGYTAKEILNRIDELGSEDLKILV